MELTFIFIIFLAIIAIYVLYFIKEKEYNKKVKDQTELLNDMVSLIQKRNGSFNKEISTYVNWLNNEFTNLSIELFLSNRAMEQLKSKHKIKDTDFIMSFQSIISDIQNIQKKRVQQILDNVSLDVIEEMKKQLGGR
jgi:hypothetical protein